MANYVGWAECDPVTAKKEFDTKSFYTIQIGDDVYRDVRPYYRRKISDNLVRVYLETRSQQSKA